MNNYFLKKIFKLSDTNAGIILFIVSFVLKLCYTGYAYLHNIMSSFKDDALYFKIAQSVLNQGKLLYETNNWKFDIIGPGLPWINAVTMFIFGQNWIGIFLVTSLISGLITLYTFKVALIIFDKRVAIFSGIWSCFYVFYFKFTPTAGKDIWMSFFLILMIYLLLQIISGRNKTIYFTLLFSFIFVYSFHLDERFIMFAPFIFFFLLINETSGFSEFKISNTFLYFLFVIILMIPWTYRNYKKYDKFVLLSNRTEKITDKIFGYQHQKLPFEKLYLTKSPDYIYDYQIDSVLTGEKNITNGGYIISEKQRKAMLSGNLPHTLSKIESYWIRTKTLLRPFQIKGEYQKTGYFYYEQSIKHKIVSFLFYGIIMLFSIYGFKLLYTNNKNIFLMLICTIFIYVLINVLFVPWTTWRYRLPIDSIIIIIGSYGFFGVMRSLKIIQKL